MASKFKSVFRNKGQITKKLGITRPELSSFLSENGYQDAEGVPALQYRSQGWTAYTLLDIGVDFWLWNYERLADAKGQWEGEFSYEVYPYFAKPTSNSIVSFRHFSDVILAKQLLETGLQTRMSDVIEEVRLHMQGHPVQANWIEELEDRLTVDLERLRRGPAVQRKFYAPKAVNRRRRGKLYPAV